MAHHTARLTTHPHPLPTPATHSPHSPPTHPPPPTGEYGNPDVAEEWAHLKRYSPYHRLELDRPYPRTLFTTSTRDDRVHPAHARKMVHKMSQLGLAPLYYGALEQYSTV